MRKIFWKNVVIAGLLAALSLTGSMATDVKADCKNELYTYQSSKDGNFSTTAWRAKDHGGSEIPKGYVYAIASEGLASSIMVRKHTSRNGNVEASNGFVTVPYLTHSCIRNNFVANSDKEVRLRVRINANSGITSGFWSPDTSQSYPYVVG